jgi:hypothetical protein
MLLTRARALLVSGLRMPSAYGPRMMSSNAKSLIYKEYGDPNSVLQLDYCTLEKPCENQVRLIQCFNFLLSPLCLPFFIIASLIFEVLVKWLYAPINPADINTIQGKYPSKPPLPAVPGNEGVGEVVEIGPNTQNLQVGDIVIPNGTNKGTWRSHAVYDFEELFKVRVARLFKGKVRIALFRLFNFVVSRLRRNWAPSKLVCSMSILAQRIEC